MAGDVVSRMDVQVVHEQRPLDAVRTRELVDELVARLLDAVREHRVQLEAVAGRQRSVLDDCRTALRSGAERADPLAQLDGSRAMAEPEADEAIHASRHCTPLRRARDVENALVRALGVDVGGTFTDGVLVSGGEVRTAKVLTRARQEESVLAVADALGATDVDRFTHGTTIATNALLEGRGARTAFVATEGFEHLLYLRRQTRAHLYRPCAERPPPLVPLEHCVGVRGRMGPHGELAPLALSSLPEIHPDAEAIAICLLFSFLDPRHEQAVAR